jgi:hypothetical protein
MSQPKDKIEFKMLDYKRVGQEHVSFELEDGTIVKVKVDLDRAGVATNHTNPDGTPHYAINTSNKTFSVDKTSGKGKSPPPPSQMFS